MRQTMSWVDSLHVPEPREVLTWLLAILTRTRQYLFAPQRRGFWVLLALAALLRFLSLDLIPFGLAQVRYLAPARAIAQGGSMLSALSSPDVGGASFFVYALSMPLRLGHDPRWASALLVVANLIALAIFYCALEHYHSRRVAILSTALFAVTPWAVLSARDIAPVGLLLPLAVLLLVGLYTAIPGRQPWGWTVVWLAAGLLAYTSPWAAPLIGIALVLTLLFLPRVRWLYALLGMLLAALILLPVLYYTQDPLPWRSLVLFFGEHDLAPAGIQTNALSAARQLHAGQGLGSLMAPSSEGFTPLQGIVGGISHLAGWLFLLSVPGIVALAARAWSHWRTGDNLARYAIPTVWLWLPLLLYWAQGALVGPEQLMVLLPAGILSMGLVLDKLADLPALLRRGGPWWASWMGVSVWLFVLAFVIWGTLATMSLYRHVARHDVSQAYGIPILFWQRTERLIAYAARENPLDTWIVTGGTNLGSGDEAALIDYLLDREAELVFLDQGTQEALLLPAERDGFYLSLQEQDGPRQLLDRLGAQNIGVVLFPAERRSAALQKLAARPAEEMLAIIPYRDWAPYDAGLCLVGYDAPYIDERQQMVTLATYWTFEAIPSQDLMARHLLGVTLYDHEGQPLTQRALVGLPEQDWREGLLLKQWHTLPLPDVLPEGPYEIHLTLDRLTDGYRHRVLDDRGQALDDRHIIGPFVLAE